MQDPPLIDAHHHFGGPAPNDAHGPEQLWPELEAERISGTVLAVAEPSSKRTRELLAPAAGIPWLRGIVGWADLTDGDVTASVCSLPDGPGGHKLVGLRHPVCDEPDPSWLAREDVRSGLAAVAAAGLAFDLGAHTSDLPAIGEACAALSDIQFVLEHLACPPIASGDLSAWGGALLELAELPNVSATLSGLVSEADPLT